MAKFRYENKRLVGENTWLEALVGTPALGHARLKVISLLFADAIELVKWGAIFRAQKGQESGRFPEP